MTLYYAGVNNCELAQGYFFFRPADHEVILELLVRNYSSDLLERSKPEGELHMSPQALLDE